MHIDTKYNIGDKAFVYDYCGDIVQASIFSISVEISRDFETSIIYRVRFDNGKYENFYESYVYANIQEVIAKEEKEEQTEIRLTKEGYNDKIVAIKERYAKKYKYLKTKL